MKSPVALALLFLAAVVSLGLAGKLSPVVPPLYLLASLVSFAVYAQDKSAARNDRWRTRESTLHLLAVAGGWPGALLAQRLLRHKSRKQSFQLFFWGTVLVNCTLLLSLVYLKS